jgi:Co/Zn/Cd efflux system component
MTDCCEHKAGELAALKSSQRRVLQTVLIVNATMFVIEAVAGVIAGSTALLADSLDMLGDALVYGFSPYVVGKARAGRPIAKGSFMPAFGLAVLIEAGYEATRPILPGAETMALIAGLALAANAFCFAVLYRHRPDTTCSTFGSRREHPLGCFFADIRISFDPPWKRRRVAGFRKDHQTIAFYSERPTFTNQRLAVDRACIPSGEQELIRPIRFEMKGPFVCYDGSHLVLCPCAH